MKRISAGLFDLNMYRRTEIMYAYPEFEFFLRIYM